jgi:hypothetical protein
LSYREPGVPGLFVKMWIGKEDYIIRKIVYYNAVDFGVSITTEEFGELNKGND